MNFDLICIASGPSLTKKDCELVRELDIKTLAVNTSWELVPWCDYVYAGDFRWWKENINKVSKNIEKWTSSKDAAKIHKINFHPANGPFNSGMRALMWALKQGFRNILLLGFDCSIKNGIHWHGLHDISKGLSNPDQNRINSWEIQFLDVYAKAGYLEAKIYNCSRNTELKCFPRLTLENALQIKKEQV